MRRFILFCLLALSLSVCTTSKCTQISSVQDRNDAGVKAIELPPPKPIEPTIHKVEAAEIQAYKLLYQDSKDANNRIISTLQWSIGLGAAFLLALAGSQIFFNYRISKEEIALIRSDNHKLIAELGYKLRSEAESRFSGIETNNDTRNKELSNLIQQYSDLSTEKIESARRELRDDIIRVKIDLDKESGHVWNLRGVEANALRQFISAALLQIKTDQKSLKYTLKEIIKVLPQMKDIEIALVKGLEEIITLAPKELAESCETIRTSIIDKPVYEFLDQLDPSTGLNYRYIKDSKK